MEADILITRLITDIEILLNARKITRSQNQINLDIANSFKDPYSSEKITMEEMFIAMEYDVAAPFELHTIAEHLNLFNKLLTTYSDFKLDIPTFYDELQQHKTELIKELNRIKNDKNLIVSYGGHSTGTLFETIKKFLDETHDTSLRILKHYDMLTIK